MSKSLQHLNSLIYWMTRLQVWGSRLNDHELEENMESVSRKLLYSSLFFEHDTVAVTGLQSAGKTTLLQEIYELDKSVLQPDVDRGEKVPVLVREEAISSHRFNSEQFRFQVTNEDVEFKRELSPLDNNRFTLMTKGSFTKEEGVFSQLPVLEVPQKVRGNSFQFALLPGLEEGNCEWWQELMQHALTASGTCIFVCDETRLAHGENKRLIDEILQRLEGAVPIVVITKTEDLDEPHRERVRQTAKEMFSLSDEEMDRVICTGTNNAAYREIWFPQLVNALLKYGRTNQTVQQRQLRHLDNLLKTEGIRAVRSMSAAAKVAAEKEGLDQSSKLAHYLGAFDAKAKEFRDDLQSRMVSALEKHRNAVKPDESLEKSRPNMFDRSVSWLTDSERKRQMKFKDDILSAWNAEEFHLEFLSTMGSIVKQSIHILGVSAKGEVSSLPTVKDSFAGLELSDKLCKNLEVIYGNRKELEFSADENAIKAFEALPLLAVEWFRLTAEKPAYVGVDLKTFNENGKGVDLEAFRNDFGEWQNTYKYIFKVTAASFGMQDALDGKIDSVPAVLSLMGITGTAAIAVTNALVIGGVLYAAIEAANRESTADYYRCEAALNHLSQATKDRCMQAYDTLIDIQRRHLIQRLSDKLGINSEFGVRLNVEHAAAQAKRNIDDFRSALREDLQLFA